MKIYRSFICIFGLFTSLKLFSEESKWPIRFKIGKEFDTAELAQNVAKEDGRINKVTFTLSLGKEIQKIELEPFLYGDHVDVAMHDYNGDGYIDIVFPLFYGSGPFAETEMWLFNPQDKRYEKSESFTGEGFDLSPLIRPTTTVRFPINLIQRGTHDEKEALYRRTDYCGTQGA